MLGMQEHVCPEVLGKYRGEWVVTCGNRVIAHHKDLRAIKDKIASCKGTPHLTKVPKADVWLF